MAKRNSENFGRKAHNLKGDNFAPGRKEVGRHHRQMDDAERNFLEKFVHDAAADRIESLDISFHAIERIQQRMPRVTFQDLKKVLVEAPLVTVLKVKHPDGKINTRVLLRSTERTWDYNVVVCYDITNNCIVTAWGNKLHDHHEGCSMSKYKLSQEECNELIINSI